MKKRILQVIKLFFWFIKKFITAGYYMQKAVYTDKGNQFAKKYNKEKDVVNVKSANVTKDFCENPLRTYINNYSQGYGIWKWDHYLDVYHRHFQKFRGKKVNIVEIGVYSGGSLKLWLDYFGEGCTVYGIDIEEECRKFEEERIKIFIGDQADRDFWRNSLSLIPEIDIIIDDGGHHPNMQMITLEEVLPFIKKGGVYLCEDVTGKTNYFASYMHGMQNHFNTFNMTPAEDLKTIATDFQSVIDSIHHYPYVFVIEKAEVVRNNFFSSRKGTSWENFYEKYQK